MSHCVLRTFTTLFLFGEQRECLPSSLNSLKSLCCHLTAPRRELEELFTHSDTYALRIETPLTNMSLARHPRVLFPAIGAAFSTPAGAPHTSVFPKRANGRKFLVRACCTCSQMRGSPVGTEPHLRTSDKQITFDFV